MAIRAKLQGGNTGTGLRYGDCPYTAHVQRYAITNSHLFGESLAARRSGLLTQARRLAAKNIDFIQLREKDLGAGELLSLAQALLNVIAPERTARHIRTKLLINSRADVAVAANADGVHLTSHADELTPDQVRELFVRVSAAQTPIISVSCHSLSEVERAKESGADLILFGPVFEKRVGDEQVQQGTGLGSLSAACLAAERVPVLALGGITSADIDTCLEAGAAGVAGIRLFR